MLGLVDPRDGPTSESQIGASVRPVEAPSVDPAGQRAAGWRRLVEQYRPAAPLWARGFEYQDDRYQNPPKPAPGRASESRSVQRHVNALSLAQQ